MDESAKEQTQQSLTEQLSNFVAKKIKILCTSEENYSKGILANLRRGVGKVPGELPELWGMLFKDFPAELNAKSSEIEPSRAEWAVYLSLTLYALHQQGHDMKNESMQSSGIGLGNAVRKLVPDGEEVEDNSAFRRFQTLVTSADIIELAHHLRGIVQLLSDKKVKLDYVKLSKDLYRYQFEESRNGIRLKWGRQYFSSDNKEENKESNSLDGVKESK